MTNLFEVAETLSTLALFALGKLLISVLLNNSLLHKVRDLLVCFLNLMLNQIFQLERLWLSLLGHVNFHLRR